MSVSAFPLQWPQHRPRTPAGQRQHGRFNKKQHNGRWNETKNLTVADALSRLQDEIDRIGARYPVVSSNLETRLDGLPRSGQREPDDPGVALYFDLKGEPHCLPCDTYHRVADNIAAIAKHIEATRAIERYGVASVREMFAGFTALPSPETVTRRTWRQVFAWPDGLEVDKGRIEVVYRALARERHPDVPGGSDAAMAELNAARAEAMREIGG